MARSVLLLGRATRLINFVILCAISLILVRPAYAWDPENDLRNPGKTIDRNRKEFDRSDLGTLRDQIDPIKHAQRVLTVAVAVATGSPDQVKEAIGAVLIDGPNCLNCSQVAKLILPKVSPAQLRKAAGSGFLVWLATGEPVLVVIDLARNLAEEHEIETDAPDFQFPPPSGPGGQPRPARTFKSSANCIAKIDDGRVIAGYVSEPKFSDSEGGNYYLTKNDRLVITAPICPEWQMPPGQRSVSSATIRYQTSQSVFGPPEMIKSFVYGTIWSGEKQNRQQISVASAKQRGTCTFPTRKSNDFTIGGSQSCILKADCTRGKWEASQSCF